MVSAIKVSAIQFYRTFYEMLVLVYYQRELRLPALYTTDDGFRQGYFFHVGGKKIKIKIPGQLMSKERKKKRDKLIIFTKNCHFPGEIESGFQHVRGKKINKAEMATFFLVRHNSGS